MSRTYRVLLIAMAVFTVAGLSIAFTNCSMRGGPISTFERSASCIAKTRQAASFLDIPQSVCDDAASYTCDLRIFRPGIKTGEHQETKCTDLASIGPMCVNTNVFAYNTDTARNEAPKELFLEGGSYNRDEVSCANIRLTSHGISLITGESEDFASALEKAVLLCRERRNP